MARRWISLVLAGLIAGCASFPKTSADLPEVTRRMDAIVVMPARFALHELGFFIAMEASEVNHTIEVEIGAAINALVAESRFRLAALDMSDSALVRDAELRAAIFEQSWAMRRVIPDLLEAGRTIDLAYPAGVDPFADRAGGAEYLLFVRGSGHFMTRGGWIRWLTFGGLGGRPQTTLAGILVDGRSGRVVWFNQVTKSGRDPRKPSDLMRVAQKLTSPLLGKSKIEPDGRRDRTVHNRPIWNGVGEARD